MRRQVEMSKIIMCKFYGTNTSSINLPWGGSCIFMYFFGSLRISQMFHLLVLVPQHWNAFYTCIVIHRPKLEFHPYFQLLSGIEDLTTCTSEPLASRQGPLHECGKMNLAGSTESCRMAVNLAGQLWDGIESCRYGIEFCRMALNLAGWH